jgi:hypothetical protein
MEVCVTLCFQRFVPSVQTTIFLLPTRRERRSQDRCYDILYSLIGWRNSLLLGVGNSQKKRPLDRGFVALETALAARNSAKIPAIFPISRDFGAEIGSLTTATCWPFDAVAQGPLRYVVHATLRDGPADVAALGR